MNIKSLGYRTDFIFNQFDGEVKDKGEYYVVKYNNNPNFFWGNLLFYKKPPEKGDFNIWKNDFKKEFSDPSIYHMTFAWDSIAGDSGECTDFITDGFELDKAVVLTTESVISPPKYNSEVSVRPITTDADFETVIQMQTNSGDDEHLSSEAWEQFSRTQMIQYKKMIAGNLGFWFGAYLDDELVGSLGLFTDREVGRFQVVTTEPKHQRKGVCSTLVYKASEYAFNNMNVSTLVMVADEEYHAAKIYESVGFKPTQKQAGLCWWDKSKTK